MSTSAATDEPQGATPSTKPPPTSNPRRNNNNKSNNKFVGDTPDLEEVTFTLPTESKGRMSQKRKIGKLSSFFAVNLKYPDLVRKIFRYEDPTVEEPEVPDDLDENNVAAQIRYREDVKEVATKRKNLESSKFTIFQVIWGQCSVALQNKLMMIEYFERALEKSDCTWLSMNIRSITYNFSSIFSRPPSKPLPSS